MILLLYKAVIPKLLTIKTINQYDILLYVELNGNFNACFKIAIMWKIQLENNDNV